MKMRKFERIAGVVALFVVAAAWVIGGLGPEIDPAASLRKALPQAAQFKPAGDEIYAGHADRAEGAPLVGYVAIARASGYGGPMRVAVGLDMSGNLAGVSVVDHKETLPFFDRIKVDDYIKPLIGKNCGDAFIPGDDIDAVSGATVSLGALAKSLRLGTRQAAEELGIETRRSESSEIDFGLPEIVLVLLLAAGFLSYSKPLIARPKARNVLRWITRLAGLAMIGFVLTIPLSIANVNSLLIGYTPDWSTSIYWYLMIVGVFAPLVLAGRDVYCQCFCPFGAAQDVLKVAGGWKYAPPRRWRIALGWGQRTLALAAIVTALLYRNPARFDYEVFGTFFTLTGAVVQFALLGVVLIASLFLVRPWCGFLCPLRAVSDYARTMRLWLLELVGKRAGDTKA